MTGVQTCALPIYDRWHVPHFEKMLYDQAQLAVAYSEIVQATGNPELERTLRETLDYVLRDLTSPEGGFYSAEDADSFPREGATEKREGAFYVWTQEEIDHLLTPEESLVFRRSCSPVAADHTQTVL